MNQHVKSFEDWGQIKTQLQASVKIPYFYEREIWWAAIGHNIGFEEDGKGYMYARPIIILRKFNQHLFWGIPLTSIERRGPYYWYFSSNNTSNTALLSQLKAFDSKRLLDRQGMISENDFEIIKQRLTDIICV